MGKTGNGANILGLENVVTPLHPSPIFAGKYNDKENDLCAGRIHERRPENVWKLVLKITTVKYIHQPITIRRRHLAISELFSTWQKAGELIDLERL